MDAALYEKLLDEVRGDLGQIGSAVEELQSVEAFLKDRMTGASDEGSYQNVLNDLTSDIDRENGSIAELARIERYVSGKLGKDSEAPDVTAAAPTSKSKPKPAAKLAAKKPAPKDDETKDEPPKDAPTGMTIEFGPDGFPLSGDAAAGKKEESVPQGTGMDGATINFGPDGFPVDFPKK